MTEFSGPQLDVSSWFLHFTGQDGEHGGHAMPSLGWSHGQRGAGCLRGARGLASWVPVVPVVPVVVVAA